MLGQIFKAFNTYRKGQDKLGKNDFYFFLLRITIILTFSTSNAQRSSFFVRRICPGGFPMDTNVRININFIIKFSKRIYAHFGLQSVNVLRTLLTCLDNALLLVMLALFKNHVCVKLIFGFIFAI